MRLLTAVLIGLLIMTAFGCSHKVTIIKTNRPEEKLELRTIPPGEKARQSDIFLAKAKKFYLKGKYKQTLSFCEKAIKFNHDNWEAHYYMGLAMQRKRLYAQSIEALKIGLRLGPESRFFKSEMHCNLAINYEKMGMAERARSEYQLALTLDSANQNARKGLNRIKVNKTMKNWKKEKRH